MIRFGTCSWKYDSWEGIVYSQKKGKNYLREYSLKYPTVEIDQWFWSLFGTDKVALPLPQIVKDYTDSVPEHFKFTIKIPNSITLTHFYRRSKSESLKPNPYFLSNSLFDDFIKKLNYMHAKVGVLMFQFEYLNRQKMGSLDEFINKFGEFIRACSDEFDYGIELRNPNYLRTSYFEFLNEFKIGHVFLQGYYMPSITDVYVNFWPYIQKYSVIRLHGPNRSGIEKKSKGLWNSVIEPKDDELSQITKIIRELDEKNQDVYVNVNNHYEGSAPLTIERIRDLLANSE
jgi:uncharacterized protein YecE (DUF72 family)